MFVDSHRLTEKQFVRMVKKKAQADEAAAAAQKAARVTRQKVKIDMNLDKPVQNESHVEAESDSVTARIKKRKRSSISQGNESSTTPKKITNLIHCHIIQMV